MRKGIKKLTVFLLLICLATVAFACNKKGEEPNGGDSTPPDAVAYLTIDKTQVELVVGRDTTITASYGNGASGDALSFSADSDVVTVDAQGKITAIKPGSTTVRAKYGELEKTCAVTVTLGGITPVVDFLHVDGSMIELSYDESVNLAARISFDGKYYTDATFDYTVEDETVGKVENGIFIPKKEGETTVVVEASWRGVESNALTETLTVKVSPVVIFSMYGELENGITLYTIDEFDEKQYDTDVTPVISLTINGTDYSSQVVMEVENKTIADFEGNKLIAKKAGTTTLKLSIASKDWKEEIPLKVIRPVAEKFETVYDFDQSTGDISDILTATFGTTDVSIESVECEGETLSITDQNVLSGFNIKGREEKTVTFYTANCGYSVKMLPITGYIAQASDLNTFKIKNGTTSNGTKVTGYYVLKSNIDASMFSFNHDSVEGAYQWAVDRAVGFYGTLDGRGYTIDGLTLGCYGMFGGLGESAVVENIAFTNVKFNDSPRNAAIQRNCTVFGANISGGTISNVYIKLDSLLTSAMGTGTESHAAVLAERLYNVTLSNVIIDYPEQMPNPTATSDWLGSLAASKQTGTINATNVYVISPTTLIKTGLSTVYDGSNCLEGTKITGTYRYADADEMEAANEQNTFSDFDNGYWTVETGKVPTWKNTVKHVEAVDLGTVYLEVADGKINLGEISQLSDILGTATEITYDTAGVTPDSGKIAATVDKAKHTLVVITQDAAYSVNIIPVTKIIKQASDLNVLKINTTSGDGAKIDGYYVLANSFTASSYSHGIASSTALPDSDWGGTKEVGFYGVFDGCGNTINGLVLERFGLFLALSETAVVKNVAFTNVTFSDTRTNRRGNTVIAAVIANGATVSDVYIKLDSLDLLELGTAETNYAGAFALYLKGATLTNIIIDYKEEIIPTKGGEWIGSLAANKYGDVIKNSSNVFVISPTPLIQARTSSGTTTFDTGHSNLVGVTRYDTATAMEDANAGNEFTAFKTSGYWTVQTGKVPVWTTATQYVSK